MPDAILMRPRVVAIFDAVKDELTVVTPVRSEPGVAARAAYDRAVNRLIDVVDALDRPLDHAPEPADIALSGEVVSNTTPAEYKAMVGAREGLHRRRRYFSGGAVAALRSALSSSRVFPLPRASPREPLAVSLLPRLRRFFDRRLEPGDPGSRARWRRDHPPDRRHQAARKNAGGGQAPRRRALGRSEGARRAPDAARPRTERCGPRLDARLACASPTSSSSSTTAT